MIMIMIMIMIIHNSRPAAAGCLYSNIIFNNSNNNNNNNNLSYDLLLALALDLLQTLLEVHEQHRRPRRVHDALDRNHRQAQRVLVEGGVHLRKKHARRRQQR